MLFWINESGMAWFWASLIILTVSGILLATAAIIEFKRKSVGKGILGIIPAAAVFLLITENSIIRMLGLNTGEALQYIFPAVTVICMVFYLGTPDMTSGGGE